MKMKQKQRPSIESSKPLIRLKPTDKDDSVSMPKEQEELKRPVEPPPLENMGEGAAVKMQAKKKHRKIVAMKKKST